MSITIETLGELLERGGLRYRQESPTQLVLGFRTDVYRNRRNEPSLGLVVRLDEDGRYVWIVAPGAFVIDDAQRAAAIETCLRFQWLFNLVRFEFDHEDGELRPAVHLPVMDGSLTADQLGVALSSVVSACNRLHPALAAALATGRVPDLRLPEPSQVAAVAERLARLTPEQLEILLAAVSGQQSDEDSELSDDAEEAA